MHHPFKPITLIGFCILISIVAPAFAAALRPGDIVLVTQGGAGLHVIDPISGEVTSFNAASALSSPNDLIIDPNGRILTGERVTWPNRGIVRIDLVTDRAEFLGGEPYMFHPVGLEFEPDGDLVVVNVSGHVVEFDLDTRTQNAFADIIASPSDLAVAGDGDVFIADFGDSRLVDGRILHLDRQTGMQRTLAAGFTDPIDVLLTNDGDLLVADRTPFAGDIWRVNSITGAKSLELSIPPPRFMSLQHDGTVLFQDDFFIDRVDLATGAITRVSNHFFLHEVSGITVFPIPEPSTLILLGVGLVGPAFVAKRRLRRN